MSDRLPTFRTLIRCRKNGANDVYLCRPYEGPLAPVIGYPYLGSNDPMCWAAVSIDYLTDARKRLIDAGRWTGW